MNAKVKIAVPREFVTDQLSKVIGAAKANMAEEQTALDKLNSSILSLPGDYETKSIKQRIELHQDRLVDLQAQFDAVNAADSPKVLMEFDL